MSKTYSLLRPPALQWNPIANTGGGPSPIVLNDLVARTWEGKAPRERDATRLPVLPNAGLVRLRLGWTPDADPAGKQMVQAPALYWGKQNTLIGLPKAAIVGGMGSDGGGSYQFIYSRILADPALVSACSDARVMLAQTVAEASQYSTVTGLGTYLTDSDYLGRVCLDAAPRTGNVATTQFLGGDCIVCIATGTLNPIISYAYDPNYTSAPVCSCYDDGSGSGVGNGNLNVLALADAAALIAAAPKYRRFRFKIYNTGAYNVLFTKLVSHLVAGGVDAIFGGDDFTVGGPVASIKADVRSFFGI